MFKFKQKIVGEKIAGGTKDVQIMVPLKYLCSFWRILEMPLINCKNNLILTWSATYVLSEVENEATIFPIIDAKLYVPAVTLSTQDNAKVLQQLELGFKRTINWNQYQPKY